MLVKYYLSDNIKAPFENFALGLRNTWAGPGNFSCTQTDEIKDVYPTIVVCIRVLILITSGYYYKI